MQIIRRFGKRFFRGARQNALVLGRALVLWAGCGGQWVWPCGRLGH